MDERMRKERNKETKKDRDRDKDSTTRVCFVSKELCLQIKTAKAQVVQRTKSTISHGSFGVRNGVKTADRRGENEAPSKALASTKAFVRNLFVCVSARPE
mmetsp:Transcript_6381/g.12959  ORF Transcript_6381/g.12959 Transcript_6381/m.12959 type:complete len:100 (-) Transcript_6381:481-780(-)